MEPQNRDGALGSARTPGIGQARAELVKQIERLARRQTIGFDLLQHDLDIGQFGHGGRQRAGE